MFTRFTPLSLALVFLFISTQTFSQIKNVLVTSLVNTFSKPATSCAADDLASDFSQGTLDANVVIASTLNGELSLRPNTVEEQFSSNTIPVGWNAGTWNTGGATNYSGGIVTLNGTRIFSSASYKPGTSMEFSAKFTLGNFENIGFAQNGNFDPFWLVIGRGGIGSDPNLYVRSSEGVATSLGGNLLNAYHTYRIDWGSSSFMIYVDGVLTATVSKTFTQPLVTQISDYNTDGTSLSVDRISFSSYPTSGTFISRVFSLGTAPATTQVNWNATLPANTGITIAVRSGNTPIPDGSWTAFTNVINNQSIGLNKIFIQYKAVLSSLTTATPQLNDISFNCSIYSNDDNTPPVISDIHAYPGPNGTALIGWTTDDPSDSRIDFGKSADVLNLSATNAEINIAHSITLFGLTQGTPYYYRVTSKNSVGLSTTDPLASDPPLQFIIPFTTEDCAKDETAPDFDAGTDRTNIEILYNAFFGNDGSISLKKSTSVVEEQFISNAIPSGWSSGQWSSGGTSTVSGGILSLNGARMYSSATSYLPGTSIEFSAKFTQGNFENIGFSQNGNFDPYWIVIGRGGIGTDPNLYVRSSDGINISLGSSLLNSYHKYEIAWLPGGFSVYVDGILSASVTKNLNIPLTINLSDYNNDATNLSIDWIRISATSYPASGTFISRVFPLWSIPDDVSVSWNFGDGNSQLSEGTDIVISVRSGKTSIPDASWTPFSIVSNQQKTSIHGNYLQYKAVLTTTNPEVAPSLGDIHFNCSASHTEQLSALSFNNSQKLNYSVKQDFILEQNRPNPFNNTTIISYSLPTSGRVMLAIYDLQGRVVKTVENAYKIAGKYNVTIDTRNMGKGVYIYRIQAGEFTAVKKMIVE